MDLTGAVAMVFFFSAVAVVLGGWIMARHRERMAIIEKGIVAEDVRALYQRGFWRPSPLSSLKWGILCVALGAGLLTGLWTHEVYRTADGFTVGLVAIFGGVGLLIFYALARHRTEQH